MMEKNEYASPAEDCGKYAKDCGKCPMSNGGIVLHNHITGTRLVDTLHKRAEPSHCTSKRCVGSMMQPQWINENAAPEESPTEKMLREARDFLAEYYEHHKKLDSIEHEKRLAEVVKEINANGTYNLTIDELCLGSKLAWRNAPRCINRAQWNNIKVYDARHVKTAKEMFDCLLTHMEYATNKGRLRSCMTIFPHTKDADKEFRVWNSQFIRYAGYRQMDGTVIGDPASVDLTIVAERLGWKGKGTRFDLLPLILQANGEPPEWFELPLGSVLEIEIEHPTHQEFKRLGLKWYAVPGVSNMALNCGGLTFKACPFNGWYLATEIGRNLTDVARYNLLKEIAECLGYDTSTRLALWQDRAIIEVNRAVLHSYQKAGVTLVDHHTVSETFMKHHAEEVEKRGGCPSDWVWIVPPISSTTCPVFHQEMLNYVLRPSFDYQKDAHKTYKFKKDCSPLQLFKKAAWSMVFLTSLMNEVMTRRWKVTILYASEFGRSEVFARELNTLLLHAFRSRVVLMSDYGVEELKQEQCVLVVASTYGNGDPPTNGESFYKKLGRLAKSEQSCLENLKFSVFAFGSSCYPNFCAFGRSMDKLFKEMGGKRVHCLGEGDELDGQQESFKEWAQDCFKAICSAVDVHKVPIPNSFKLKPIKAVNVRVIPSDSKEIQGLQEDLALINQVKVFEGKVISNKNLVPKSDHCTQLLKISVDDVSFKYTVGDHLAVYPSNDPEKVKQLFKRVGGCSDRNALLHVVYNVKGEQKWEHFTRIPQPNSLQQVFTHYLDFMAPPTRRLLRLFAERTSDQHDQKTLLRLAQSTVDYEEWRLQKEPSVLQVLLDYPSINIDIASLIYGIRPLQPRFYCISSSQLENPGEVHLTVGVLQYTVVGTERYGLCSNYIKGLKTGDRIMISHKSAPTFYLPNDPLTPLVMVGPGVGIAPLRAFWQMRSHSEDKRNGEAVLFVGCRNKGRDDLYTEEIEKALKCGALSQAFTAYSRDFPQTPKMYVQNVMKENSSILHSLLVEQKGHLYVCGDLTMAGDVKTALTELLSKSMDVDIEQAGQYLQDMREAGRYHQDAFGIKMDLVKARRLSVLRPPSKDALPSEEIKPVKSPKKWSWRKL